MQQRSRPGGNFPGAVSLSARRKIAFPQMHNPPQRFCAGEGFFVFLVYSRNFRINSFREAG